MIQLTDKPISFEQIQESVIDPTCGAVVCFEGRVRNHHKGKKVLSLEYEVYSKMALNTFVTIVEQAKEKWLLGQVTISHRYGHLTVGDIAVIVAVASAHRKEAFEACSAIMDQVKKQAPIWKKEHYENGESEWVFCQEHSLQGGLVSGSAARKL